jgi:tRNA-dihydrouridine synthase 1
MVSQSDYPFRLLCQRYGVDLCYTQMLHSRNFASSGKYREQNFDGGRSLNEDPLIAQFCGDDPQTLLAAAKCIENEVSAVDLNLGCPQGIARRGNYGSFLLPNAVETTESNTALLQDIVRTLHNGLAVPVTCKIRALPLAEDPMRADVPRTVALALALQEAGCSLLTVHGRTLNQNKQYCGAADWSVIRTVKQALDIPVVANGGIETMEDAERCIRETGVDAVMTSEALLGNPAMFIHKASAVTSPDAGGGGQGGESAAPAQVPTPFELVREYLALVRLHPIGYRQEAVVKSHLFKILHSHIAFIAEHQELKAKAQAQGGDGGVSDAGGDSGASDGNGSDVGNDTEAEHTGEHAGEVRGEGEGEGESKKGRKRAERKRNGKKNKRKPTIGNPFQQLGAASTLAEIEQTVQEWELEIAGLAEMAAEEHGCRLNSTAAVWYRRHQPLEPVQQ